MSKTKSSRRTNLLWTIGVLVVVSLAQIYFRCNSNSDDLGSTDHQKSINIPYDASLGGDNSVNTLGLYTVITNSNCSEVYLLLFYLSLEYNQDFYVFIQGLDLSDSSIIKLHESVERSTIDPHKIIFSFSSRSSINMYRYFTNVNRIVELTNSSLPFRGFVEHHMACASGQRCPYSFNNVVGIDFVVLTSWFKRDIDPQYNIPRLTSLASIKKQTHAKWLLILGLDGQHSSEQTRVLESFQAAGIDSSKYFMVHMRPDHRENVVYNSSDVWSFAGINVYNLLLRFAYSTSAKYIAHLDDDDLWLPDHLMNHLNGYTMHPNATFAFSSASELSGPAFPNDISKSVYLRPPKPCGLVHSSVSWSVRLNVYYRHKWEQLRSTRGSRECCGPCKSFASVLPADADLWERVNYLVEIGNMSSIYIATVDVSYTNQTRKECLAKLLKGSPKSLVSLEHCA